MREIGRDGRAGDKRKRNDRDRWVYYYAITQVVATREVGIGDCSDALACRQFHCRDVEAYARILTNVEAYGQWPSKPEAADLHLIANSFTAPLMYFVMQSRWVQHHLYSMAVVNPATLTDATLESFATKHLANALRS